MDFLDKLGLRELVEAMEYKARLATLSELHLVHNLANRTMSLESVGERWSRGKMFNRRNELLAEIEAQVSEIPTDERKGELIRRIIEADKAYAQGPQKA